MTVYHQSNHLIKCEDTVAGYKTHSVDELKKVMVSFSCNTSISTLTLMLESNFHF